MSSSRASGNRIDVDQYAAALHDLCLRWHKLTETDATEADTLVRRTLAHGLDLTPEVDLPQGRPTPEEIRGFEAALIAASEEFDVKGYVASHRDKVPLQSGRRDPIEHFVVTGSAWLHSPKIGFDTWWYWNEYLDPTRTDLNPFVHYLVRGRHDGLATQPTVIPPRAGAPDGASPHIRRICLFAAYDLHGQIDDYVVAYLTELSRFADVYYLADGTITDTELAKLARVTEGAWAIPHGRYDFGSFALLANELVGWDLIDEYDELMFANDSCFLVGSLAPVFEHMSTRAADWWGLQAAKRNIDALHGYTEPISLAEAKADHTEAEDWSPYYRLHLSSYFLVFRKRVMQDEGFRRRLGEIVAQRDKMLIIFKYEIGLSDYLIKSGYDFDAFLDGLYPFHPLYTADHFTILGLGFPLLKRNFITDNPRRVPDMASWKRRVLEFVPGAPVSMFEANIERIAGHDRLMRSFAVRTDDDGSLIDPYEGLSHKQFRALDDVAPKFDHWWAFPVCAFDHTFAGNERAVFEEIRSDPAIKKIILTRSKPVRVDGENVVSVPIGSPEGQYYLARAKQIFVKHGPTINVPWPVNPQKHNFINLWHGIPLKRFGSATLNPEPHEWKGMLVNNSRTTSVVASSRMDALAINAAFFPASYPDVWVTGLPRNDFVTRQDESLPADLLAAADRLREEVAGRRLVLFLPTFKDGQADAYYTFSDEEVHRLTAWAQRHNAVIGVRQHMADKAKMYAKLLEPVGTIDVTSTRYPDLEVLYRVADALVSDYSSCLVDFLLTGKPVISFAYDYDRYANEERGLFYELDHILPGPVCRTFDKFEVALDDVFRPRSDAEKAEYGWRRRFFFDHVDDQSARRLVQRVKRMYVPEA
jgi:CDP-glycerol glycerophosphotransferase (TagB/SpsB family)